MLICDGSILLGMHCSSKKVQNKRDQDILKHQLKHLEKFHVSLNVIVGGDMNSYLSGDKLQNYTVYPKSKMWITTNKKRTYLQAQYEKADDKVS